MTTRKKEATEASAERQATPAAPAATVRLVRNQILYPLPHVIDVAEGAVNGLLKEGWEIPE